MTHWFFSELSNTGKGAFTTSRKPAPQILRPEGGLIRLLGNLFSGMKS